MARTLTPALLTAQTYGYPTGGYAPAVRCIFTSKDGVVAGAFVTGTIYRILTVGNTDFTLIGASANTVGIIFTATGVGSGTGTANIAYDYSFDPTVNTNRLIHAQQIEERGSDSGIIQLSNYDKSVPADLTGYYVDLGWGHNTSDGVLPSSTDDAGAVSPRMWVMSQSDISGGQKGQRPGLFTVFQLQGVWGAVLNRQPVLLPSEPNFTIPLYRYDELSKISILIDKTIYEILEYLIETTLSNQTGYTFTLDPLGTQDDGQINDFIPFSSSFGENIPRTINSDSPFYFMTYGDLIRGLLELTKCVLVPRAGLAFRIIYPQASDTADETYYSSNADGHPFYEVLNTRLNMTPNHIEIFGGEDETTGYPTVSGHWFDTDHYSGWVSPATTATYDGPFMEVKASGSTDNILWETDLDTVAKCRTRAAELGWQLKDQILGTRVIVPMDARVELYDRVSVKDSRG